MPTCEQCSNSSSRLALHSWVRRRDRRSHPSTVWVYIVFIVGNLIGTPVIGMALLRSRVVPVWGAIGVIAWAPFHVTGLVFGSEWFEVVGALLQAVGFATVGAALLGRASALVLEGEAGTGKTTLARVWRR